MFILLIWPYDEWAKIAPLSFFNDKPLNIIKWFDPSGFVFVDNRSMREIDEDERHFGYLFKPEEKTMCYQVEVLEYNEDKAIITVGESKFLAYHDTEVNVEECFDDCWDYARESHYTKSNGKHEVDARTILNSLYVITFEDSDTDERLDIHIPNDRISKDLTRAIEDAIALAAIAKKEQELENAANSFDWSVGHVSHYYI